MSEDISPELCALIQECIDDNVRAEEEQQAAKIPGMTMEEIELWFLENPNGIKNMGDGTVEAYFWDKPSTKGSLITELPGGKELGDPPEFGGVVPDLEHFLRTTHSGLNREQIEEFAKIHQEIIDGTPNSKPRLSMPKSLRVPHK